MHKNERRLRIKTILIRKRMDKDAENAFLSLMKTVFPECEVRVVLEPRDPGTRHTEGEA
jgi:hypothetical protein